MDIYYKSRINFRCAVHGTKGSKGTKGQINGLI